MARSFKRVSQPVLKLIQGTKSELKEVFLMGGETS